MPIFKNLPIGKINKKCIIILNLSIITHVRKMKVSNSGNSKNIKKTKTANSTNKAADSNFSKLVENTGITNSNGELLVSSLQNINIPPLIGDILEDSKKPKYTAKIHADNILEELEDLRLDILSGAVSLSKLQNMAKKIENCKIEIKDKNLKAIIDEIHLRAEVEIAKYTNKNKL